MSCTSCGSKDAPKFNGEVALLLPGPVGVEPTLFLWSDVVVCLVCGAGQFSVPKSELPILAKGTPVAGFWHD